MPQPSRQQQQVWILQRLQRICENYRKSLTLEPCLEQYEVRVQKMMGEEVTPAAAAWIEEIVSVLRLGARFSAEEFAMQLPTE